MTRPSQEIETSIFDPSVMSDLCTTRSQEIHLRSTNSRILQWKKNIHTGRVIK